MEDAPEVIRAIHEDYLRLGADLGNVVLVFGVAEFPLFARMARGETLRLRSAPFVEAAVASGASEQRVLVRHLLPNMAGVLVVVAAFEMAAMILYEAGVGFLGLSVPPMVPSWGNMLADARGTGPTCSPGSPTRPTIRTGSRPRSLASYDRITCPVFVIGGWRDGYPNPLRLFEHLRVPCRVLIGPWDHARPDAATPGPRIDYLHEMRRWTASFPRLLL